jgi:hypothetical protein
VGKHFLLSSSTDKTIVLWDLRPSPPQAHYTFKGHADPVTAMCLIGIFLTLFSSSLLLALSILLIDLHLLTFCTGTDLIAAAGHKLSAEPLLREDPPGSVLKVETYRLQNVTLHYSLIHFSFITYLINIYSCRTSRISILWRSFRTINCS